MMGIAGLVIGLTIGVVVGWLVAEARMRAKIREEKARLRLLYKTANQSAVERTSRPGSPGRRARVSTADFPRTTNPLS